MTILVTSYIEHLKSSYHISKQQAKQQLLSSSMLETSESEDQSESEYENESENEFEVSWPNFFGRQIIYG